MNITECKDFINRSDVEKGIAKVRPFKVCVRRGWGKDITPLMDEIENHFRVYQYRKDNGVRFTTEDLFYWTSADEPRADGLHYFDLSLNKKQSEETQDKILAELLDIIRQWDGMRTVDEPIKVEHHDGTVSIVERSHSSAEVDYHSVLVDQETLHQKALENLARIGSRKCEYGSMTGHFVFGNPHGVLFRKFRSKTLYYTRDDSIARAELCK